MDADARHLARRAASVAASLDRDSRREGAPTPWRRRLRLRHLELARQAVVRKARTLLREHWDIAVFDVLFGSLKAFGVYPALYFGGLAWTIPIMEGGPLNTQLWTAGYLVLRGEVLSALGRRRYGHSLKELDALRDRLLDARPGDVHHVHRFELGGAPRVLRVRQSRFRSWLARRRGVVEPGVVHASALRALVADPELLFRANPLRANPFLYEQVLLAKLLATPQAHAALLELSTPEEPLEAEGRALRAALGEPHVLALARLNEQADALASALRGRGASGACLRAIHAALRRAALRRVAALRDHEYRLLADVASGASVAASPHVRALHFTRASLRAEIARAARFAERASSAGTEAAARRLAREALGDTRVRGLAAQRARFAAWLGGDFATAAGIALATPVLPR